MDTVDHTHIQVEAFTWRSHGNFNLLHCHAIWDGEHRNLVRGLEGRERGGEELETHMLENVA